MKYVTLKTKNARSHIQNEPGFQSDKQSIWTLCDFGFNKSGVLITETAPGAVCKNCAGRYERQQKESK